MNNNGKPMYFFVGGKKVNLRELSDVDLTRLETKFRSMELTDEQQDKFESVVGERVRRGLYVPQAA